MSSYEYSFKVLLVGDSGVGKSTFLVSFVSSSPPRLNPTIGVDFKIKHLAIDGKRLKLTIWDTAGQERFGTLISSYYRGAHGIMLVYDVTNRQSFSNLTRQWAKEVELYSTEPQCVKILVANKLDREHERAVSREEGIALAGELNCLFYECSARTGENVRHCFKDLTFKILEVPSLVEKGRAVVKKQQSAENHTQHTTNCCCSESRSGVRREIWSLAEVEFGIQVGEGGAKGDVGRGGEAEIRTAPVDQEVKGGDPSPEVEGRDPPLMRAFRGTTILFYF